MWVSIAFKIGYLLSCIWWGYCVVGTYKHFDELSYAKDRDSVAVGILAEIILLIHSIVNLVTV